MERAAHDIMTAGVAIGDVTRQLALEMPGAVAAEDATITLTFSELERLSNQIANAILGAYPSGADGPLALVFGHGLRPFITALSALKTGIALAPFDAREPLDRLVEGITAVGASLIVTDPEHAPVALAGRANRAIPVLVLDDTTVAAAAPTEPAVAMSPDALGFLFFTSGSTGTPKGVLYANGHRALAALAFGAEHGYGPGDRVAVTGSSGFVLGHSYFFAAVLSGATACCYDLKARGTSGFPEWIVAHDITCVGFVPSVLRALPASAPRMESVRLVCLGSETVYGYDIMRARQHFGNGTVFKNVMGSSEAGVVATYAIGPDDEPDDGPLPAGRIWPGVTATVVDVDSDERVDAGTPGRLVIVSEHLSLGYWHDPELTAEQYFTHSDGRRGVRTNDLVRFREDGLLEHLGRLDERVKVSGAMVAPATVEAALLALDGVIDAAAVATETVDGGTRLVAFVAGNGATALSGWKLRRDLALRIPTTMLPAAIVIVDELPRTVRGKVDREALPPVPARPPYRAPFGKERELAELFGDLLGVDRVGLDDDFFELGGDSLGVVELVTAISEHFGIDIAASLILEAPTVAQLAPRLTHRRAFDAPTVVPLRSEGTGTRFFCCTGGGAPAISLRALSETMECPFYGIQPRGLEERAVPDHSVVAAARRALRHVRATQAMGPYAVGGYSFGGLVAFEIACRLVTEGERIGLLVILDTPAPGHDPTRTDRVRTRAARFQHDAPDTGLVRDAVVAGRAARFGVQSAVAHAERRIALTSAGLWPRRGLAQYELFLRLNSRMAREYRPTAPLDAPALIVRTDAGRRSGMRFHHDLGWSEWILGPITVVDVSGDHLGLLRHPMVLEVGAHLRAALHHVAVED